MADPTIPIAPAGQAPSSTPTGGNATATATTASTTASGGDGSAMSAYEKRQNKKEQEAKRKAAERYLKQAETLNAQARALRRALGSGYEQALNQLLANTNLVTRQQDTILRDQYKERLAQLDVQNEDNNKAAGDQSAANQSNRGRERANAVSEAMAQGAGESDLLRAQTMALRNWEANQGEINRGFYDSRTSINSKLNDLNLDTKTARANLAVDANGDREQAWNGYYDQMSQSYTQLGNIRGQQAELYGLANEQVGSKKTRRLLNQAEKGMSGAYMSATEMTSTRHRNPGIPKNLMQWEGRDDFTGEMNYSKFANRAEFAETEAPEGAQLRKWTT